MSDDAQKTQEAPQEEPQEEAAEVIRPGRPFKFESASQLRVAIQTYFDLCDPRVVTEMRESGISKDNRTIFIERETLTEQIPYTITGLARHLKVSRQTLINYRKPEHFEKSDMSEQERQEIFATIEDGIQRVEEYNERQLHKSGISNGIKFNLTNNFGWEDKTVQETKTVSAELDEIEKEEQRTELADEAAAELAKQNAKVDKKPKIKDEPAPEAQAEPEPLPEPVPVEEENEVQRPEA